MPDPMLAPLITLGGGAVGVYLFARLVTRHNGTLALLTAVAHGAALALLLRPGMVALHGEAPTWAARAGAAPVLRLDPAGVLLSATALVLACAVSLYSGRYLALDRRYEDYYPLVLCLSAGLVGMLSAADLLTLYLFTMLTSASSYVLVAYRRTTETAIEAGFKYTIMGGVGGILILAGIGYVYRDTGTFALPLRLTGASVWGPIGVALIVAGYGIKGALVPAHTWLPDAHGRAPSSVSALLSGIVIEVNLLTLIRVALAMGWPARSLGVALIVASQLNMIVGNMLALRQPYGKRLLGYSSIAQVGYMMLAFGMGLAYAQPLAIAAGLFMVVAHAAIKGLAFLCKGVCHFYCDATEVAELAGMGQRIPLVSGCFVVALAGLFGAPPLGSFVAKWQLLVGTASVAEPMVWLAVAGLLVNTLLSLAYATRLIVLLLRSSGLDVVPQRVSIWMSAPIVALTLLVVGLGLAPQPLMDLGGRAARMLLGGG